MSIVERLGARAELLTGLRKLYLFENTRETLTKKLLGLKIASLKLSTVLLTLYLIVLNYC